jgi:potassium-transporting ATPase KdpC subunit
MKQHIFPAIKLTVLCFLLLSVLYPLLIWGIAQAAPANGKGETVIVDNKTVGYQKEGQLFTQDKYFWSRPSAVNYNGAGSGGSNKGPTNPDYLKDVQARIDSFLAHNPGVTKQQIPSDMITASGSGLDPDISPEAAYIQAKRIATIRAIPEAQVRNFVTQHIQKPLIGLLGTSKINVLKLNIALDKLKK